MGSMLGFVKMGCPQAWLVHRCKDAVSLVVLFLSEERSSRGEHAVETNALARWTDRMQRFQVKRGSRRLIQSQNFWFRHESTLMLVYAVQPNEICQSHWLTLSHKNEKSDSPYAVVEYCVYIIPVGCIIRSSNKNTTKSFETKAERIELNTIVFRSQKCHQFRNHQA